MARIYVIVETMNGTPYIAGGALTEDNAVIAADKLADNVVNTGAIPKVTPRNYATPPTTEPREIRRYEFKRPANFPPYHITVLEMEAETNPDY